jgi:hypothetical protein
MAATREDHGHRDWPGWRLTMTDQLALCASYEKCSGHVSTAGLALQSIEVAIHILTLGPVSAEYGYDTHPNTSVIAQNDQIGAPRTHLQTAAGVAASRVGNQSIEPRHCSYAGKVALSPQRHRSSKPEQFDACSIHDIVY